MPTYDERIPLGGEDLDRIDRDRVMVHAVDLDDPHVMVVDGERVVRVARNVDQPHTISVCMLASIITNRQSCCYHSPLAVLDTND